MGDRLPKKLEDYLIELSEHEGEPGYLKRHLESIPFQDALAETVLLEGLSYNDLIYTQGDSFEVYETDDSLLGISSKPTFFLTANAKLYLEDLARIKRRDAAKTAHYVLSVLGSLAAMATLAVTIYLGWFV